MIASTYAYATNQPRSQDIELTLYARRELQSTTAVLHGRHQTMRRHRKVRRLGGRRMAGRVATLFTL
jgi:hypothetical protein